MIISFRGVAKYGFDIIRSLASRSVPEQTANDEITFDGDEAPQDETEVEVSEQQQREVVAETIAVDYLHWQDYYTFPPKARTEQEIEGKGRRHIHEPARPDGYVRRGRWQENTPRSCAPMDDQESGASKHTSSDNEDANQATVYEIWWKPERKVYFVAKEWDKCLDS